MSEMSGNAKELVRLSRKDGFLHLRIGGFVAKLDLTDVLDVVVDVLRVTFSRRDMAAFRHVLVVRDADADAGEKTCAGTQNPDADLAISDLRGRVAALEAALAPDANALNGKPNAPKATEDCHNWLHPAGANNAVVVPSLQFAAARRGPLQAVFPGWRVIIPHEALPGHRFERIVSLYPAGARNEETQRVTRWIIEELGTKLDRPDGKIEWLA